LLWRSNVPAGVAISHIIFVRLGIAGHRTHPEFPARQPDHLRAVGAVFEGGKFVVSNSQHANAQNSKTERIGLDMAASGFVVGVIVPVRTADLH